MHVAEDPINQDEVTVEEFRKRHRRRTIDDRTAEALALCPACQTPLIIVAEGERRVSHFRHVTKKVDCPIVKKVRQPFFHLMKSHPNFEVGRALKASFRSNWKRHHNLLQSLIAAFSLDEFQELLKAADERGLWNLRGISERDIPYLMLTLFDFPPRTGQKHKETRVPKRHFWISFCFRQIAKPDELWIRNPTHAVLVRLLFDCPPGSRARPNASDFRKWQPLGLDEAFVRSGDEDVDDWISGKMMAWFLKHWGM